VGAGGEGVGKLSGGEELGGDAGLCGVGGSEVGDFLEQASEAGLAPGAGGVGGWRRERGDGGGEEVGG
jgi:hypothetical protein